MQVIRHALYLALPVLQWLKAEFSAEEEDAGAIVLEGTKAAGVGLEGLDLTVEPLGDGVGDRMAQVGEDVLQVAPDHFRHLDDGLELAAGGPSIPAFEELARGALIAVSPYQTDLHPLAGHVQLHPAHAPRTFDSRAAARNAGAVRGAVLSSPPIFLQPSPLSATK